MHHDGSNSARARSARIRAAHDDEATRLESMRRNARTQHRACSHSTSARPSASLERRSSALGRAHRWKDDPLQGLEVDAERDGA